MASFFCRKISHSRLFVRFNCDPESSIISPQVSVVEHFIKNVQVERLSSLLVKSHHPPFQMIQYMYFVDCAHHLIREVIIKILLYSPNSKSQLSDSRSFGTLVTYSKSEQLISRFVISQLFCIVTVSLLSLRFVNNFRYSTYFCSFFRNTDPLMIVNHHLFLVNKTRYQFLPSPFQVFNQCYSTYFVRTTASVSDMIFSQRLTGNHRELL